MPTVWEVESLCQGRTAQENTGVERNYNELDNREEEIEY